MTREERIARKRRIVYLLCIAVWFAFLVVVLLWKSHEPEDDVAVPTVVEEAPVTVYSIPKPTESTETDEGGDVEAVPMEADPVRDDIPLDAETQRVLWQVCDETGIRYELALAVIWQETDFRNVEGDGGDSIGYMQVQKKYHGDRMKRLGVNDLTDPYSNFLVGCDYLVELIAKDKGIEWALMAYNGGANYANSMVRAEKVSQYAEEILRYWEWLNVQGEI